MLLGEGREAQLPGTSAVSLESLGSPEKREKSPEKSWRDSQTAVAKWKAFSATLGRHIQTVKSITTGNIN